MYCTISIQESGFDNGDLGRIKKKSGNTKKLMKVSK